MLRQAQHERKIHNDFSTRPVRPEPVEGRMRVFSLHLKKDSYISCQSRNYRRFVMAEFGVLVLPRPDAPQEVKLLEEMGFDVALIPDSQALAREVYVTLTACAANTSRITLGTGITNPFTRHPSVTAAAIASLNDFSGGRALLGIGRGDSAVRKIGHEIAPLRPYRAYVEAVRGLLAGETVEYVGARFEL